MGAEGAASCGWDGAVKFWSWPAPQEEGGVGGGLTLLRSLPGHSGAPSPPLLFFGGGPVALPRQLLAGAVDKRRLLLPLLPSLQPSENTN